MFGIGHGYRLDRLEKCCEKLGSIIADHESKKTKLEENLDHISKNLDKHLRKFEEHDGREMEKYDKIQNELSMLKRIIWIAIGAGVTLQFLVSNGLLRIGFANG